MRLAGVERNQNSSFRVTATSEPRSRHLFSIHTLSLSLLCRFLQFKQLRQHWQQERLGGEAGGR